MSQASSHSPIGWLSVVIPVRPLAVLGLSSHGILREQQLLRIHTAALWSVMAFTKLSASGVANGMLFTRPFWNQRMEVLS